MSKYRYDYKTTNTLVPPCPSCGRRDDDRISIYCWDCDQKRLEWEHNKCKECDSRNTSVGSCGHKLCSTHSPSSWFKNLLGIAVDDKAHPSSPCRRCNTFACAFQCSECAESVCACYSCKGMFYCRHCYNRHFLDICSGCNKRVCWHYKKGCTKCDKVYCASCANRKMCSLYCSSCYKDHFTRACTNCQKHICWPCEKCQACFSIMCMHCFNRSKHFKRKRRCNECLDDHIEPPPYPCKICYRGMESTVRVVACSQPDCNISVTCSYGVCDVCVQSISRVEKVFEYINGMSYCQNHKF